MAENLTSNTGEMEIHGLLGGNSIFEIPLFQRQYKWTDKELDRLQADVDLVIGEEAELHFLGAIIVHGRPSDPGRPRVYEVIDGQQRLTTIFLHLCAASQVLIEKEEYEDAAGLITSYIVTNRPAAGMSNSVLQPSIEDRHVLNMVIRNLVESEDEQFKASISGTRFVSMAAAPSRTGRIKKNFDLLLKFYRERATEKGIQGIRDFYGALLNSATVVLINVKDPTNGPKIFDSLNSRQHPMTIGDLVRNEVFSKLGHSDPSLAQELNNTHWQPFYDGFNSGKRDTRYFDQYFFPYALIEDRNARRSDAYAVLRRKWSGKEPITVINELRQYQNPFMSLMDGTFLTDAQPNVREAVKSLHLMNAPSSTYPFLMRLIRGHQEGRIGEIETEAVLRVTESFLVRRAICGFEPTGLHAVFKRLWNDLQSQFDPEKMIEAITEHRTIVFPADNQVKDAVLTRPLYGSKICPYVVRSWEDSLKGDVFASIPWIEHVLPQSPNKDSRWFDEFSDSERERLTHVLGNLIPLSSQMNVEVRNSDYELKRPIYEQDSGFRSARKLARDYDVWTPSGIETRGQELADWSVKRWPFSPDSF